MNKEQIDLLNKIIIFYWQNNSIPNNQPEWFITQEIIKQLTLTNVSQQRELLKACFSALDEVNKDNATITDEDAFIDEIIQDFNCG